MVSIKLAAFVVTSRRWRTPHFKAKLARWCPTGKSKTNGIMIRFYFFEHNIGHGFTKFLAFVIGLDIKTANHQPGQGFSVFRFAPGSRTCGQCCIDIRRYLPQIGSCPRYQYPRAMPARVSMVFKFPPIKMPSAHTRFVAGIRQPCCTACCAPDKALVYRRRWFALCMGSAGSSLRESYWSF